MTAAELCIHRVAYARHGNSPRETEQPMRKPDVGNLVPTVRHEGAPCSVGTSRADDLIHFHAETLNGLSGMATREQQRKRESLR